jgi:large subunit ribosomal protein L37Ae
MARTKKIKSAGRFGAGYGLIVRKKLQKVESIQRKKQICPFCKKATAKRVATGIWECNSCKKRFASNAYNTIQEDKK